MARMKYRGFISYSQKDAAAARMLHGWLETWRLPKSEGEPPGAEQRRLGRFFRDDEEMAAASNIAAIVRDAIDESECLIVVCSPRSAQSKWVNAEINYFRQSGRNRNVFAFIIDGAPNSGDPATECFPAAFRVAADPDNKEAMPIEPLALDLRKDGRARALTR
jgi:hypothetical protein